MLLWNCVHWAWFSLNLKEIFWKQIHQSTGKWFVGILVFKKMSKFMWCMGQIKHPNNLKWDGRICVNDYTDLYAAFWLFFNNHLSFSCYWRNYELLFFFFFSKADTLHGQTVLFFLCKIRYLASDILTVWLKSYIHLLLPKPCLH